MFMPIGVPTEELLGRVQEFLGHVHVLPHFRGTPNMASAPLH